MFSSFCNFFNKTCVGMATPCLFLRFSKGVDIFVTIPFFNLI
eukprot:UN20509